MSKSGLRTAFVATAGAVVAAVVGYHFGGQLHTDVAHTNTRNQIITYSSAAIFFGLGTFAARQIANAMGRAVAKADPGSASVIRLVFTVVGVVIVAFVTLGILHIGVSRLLLG